ncbi:MAG: NAD(P)H-quinone oxidoreductase [Acidimicrobiales bacterium]
MRAVTINGFGDVDVLGMAEVADPVIGPEEVLVAVNTTAMNRADLLQRMGLYAPPPGATDIPGLEFSGEVVQIGSRVTEAEVGERVMGIVGGGAHAELVATHQRMLLKTPNNLSDSEAAAIPEVFLTAFDALVIQGNLRSGGWALVHAGASGVGTAAIQIAKAVGANVIVTASTLKVAKCLELGADVAVDYTQQNFLDEAMAATNGRGVDVVLDVIGPKYLNDNVAALRTGGFIIQVGLMGGVMAEFNMGAILGKRAHLVGTTLRARDIEDKIMRSQRFAHEILPLIASGVLRPVIDSVYPLDKIADAHAYMETNANIGKILLSVAG